MSSLTTANNTHTNSPKSRSNPVYFAGSVAFVAGIVALLASCGTQKPQPVTVTLKTSTTVGYGSNLPVVNSGGPNGLTFTANGSDGPFEGNIISDVPDADKKLVRGSR